MTALPQGSPMLPSTKSSDLVNVVSWTFTIFSICIVLFTLVYKLNTECRRRPRLDEILIFFTVIFQITQSGVICGKILSGLGTGYDTLSVPAMQTLLKVHLASPDFSRITADTIEAIYEVQLLTICVLFLSKASTLRTLHQVTPLRKQRRAILLVFALATVWALAAVLGIAFQCALPEPWLYEGKDCINRTGLWISIAALDSIVDLAIVVVPIFITRSRKISHYQRKLVLIAFSIRLLCVPISIVRSVYLSELYSYTPAFTNADYPVVITTELEIFLAVLSTAGPHLWILREPLRATYLAAATANQPPPIHRNPLRISWSRSSPLSPISIALKPLSPVSALRRTENDSRTELHALFGVERGLVQDMGLEGGNSTRGRASRASDSTVFDFEMDLPDSPAPPKTGDGSKSDGGDREEGDGVAQPVGNGGFVVQQTRDWSYCVTKLD